MVGSVVTKVKVLLVLAAVLAGGALAGCVPQGPAISTQGSSNGSVRRIPLSWNNCCEGWPLTEPSSGGSSIPVWLPVSVQRGSQIGAGRYVEVSWPVQGGAVIAVRYFLEGGLPWTGLGVNFGSNSTVASNAARISPSSPVYAGAMEAVAARWTVYVDSANPCADGSTMLRVTARGPLADPDPATEPFNWTGLCDRTGELEDWFEGNW